MILMCEGFAMHHVTSGQLNILSRHRHVTSFAGRSGECALLAAASVVAAWLGPIAVAVVALVSAFVVPSLVMTSVSHSIGRHTLGDIDPRSLTATRRIAVSARTRLDTVSRAMAASGGIELVAGQADLTIHGLCGSIVDSAKGRSIVRGGVPQLLRAIALSRRAMVMSRVAVVAPLMVTFVAMVAVVVGLSGFVPGSLLLLTMAVLLVAVNDLDSDRHLSGRHMTRMQRRIQRRFETMFRGI
jgi:hypothetical protein